MVLLSRPHRRFHRSYLEAVDEFRAAGEQQHDGVLVWEPEGSFDGVRFTREGLEDPTEFGRFVDHRLADELPDSPRPPGWVPSTVWWMSELGVPDVYVGQISLRHSLDHPLLRDLGGHIGYGVRPAFRRRGHAADALRQVVALAAQRGLEEVLVTCDVDNTASARTIVSQGGVYENQIGPKSRYWITTGASRRSSGGGIQ